MPTRRKIAAKETSGTKEEAPKTSRSTNSRTITLKVPQTPVILLVLALMVVSFLVGVLGTNIAYKLNGASTTAATTPGTAAGTGGTTPAVGAKVDVANGHFPALGKDSAKVTVIEFADFRCPFCQQLFTNVSPSLQKDYIDSGKVKFYFRQYAFLGPASTVAANAAECANEQNKFWELHDWLYKNQPPETDTSMYTVDNLTTQAGNLGINTAQFKDCLSSNKYQKKVDQDLAEGQKAGVQGTPATFINGKLISGAVPYAQFKAAIDAELAK